MVSDPGQTAISFTRNCALKIIHGNSILSIPETEELSYVFIDRLLNQSGHSETFTIGFPFDMIEFFCMCNADKTITIGWNMYDNSEREEICMERQLFFESLIAGLENYFKSIETDTPLENYIIDNNPQRNRTNKWNRSMPERLRNKFLR